jgi:hypothetical protein
MSFTDGRMIRGVQPFGGMRMVPRRTFHEALELLTVPERITGDDTFASI